MSRVPTYCSFPSRTTLYCQFQTYRGNCRTWVYQLQTLLIDFFWTWYTTVDDSSKNHGTMPIMANMLPSNATLTVNSDSFGSKPCFQRRIDIFWYAQNYVLWVFYLTFLHELSHAHGLTNKQHSNFKASNGGYSPHLKSCARSFLAQPHLVLMTSRTESCFQLFGAIRIAVDLWSSQSQELCSVYSNVLCLAHSSH